jgi:hypothetical protein
VIQIREIISMTALNFGVEPIELLSANRTRHVATARMIAMWLARKHTKFSYAAIGAVFDRDHTSVIHAVERIDAEIRGDRKLAALVESIGRNVAFREEIEALGGVDVLACARRISASPVNRAIGASVMETAALAATVLDLWDIALAADELAAGLDAMWRVEDDTAFRDEFTRLTAFGRSIRECLAAMGGEAQQDLTINQTEES